MSEGGALREIAGKFGIEWDDSSIGQGVTSLNSALEVLGKVKQAVQAVVGAIRDFALDFERDAGHVEDSAHALGLATTELQELQYASIQGGASAEDMTRALARLERSAAQAASGNRRAAGAFRALGVSVKDANGQTRSAGDILDDLAVGFDGIEDPARRMDLAQRLLGGSARKLLPILKQGEGGLAQWRAELGELGGGFSPEAIAAAGAFGDELNRFKVAVDSVRSAIAVALMPVLTWLLTQVTRLTAWFAKLSRSSSIMQALLVALGVAAGVAAAAIVAALASVLAPLAPLIAGFAALVLILDDVITWLRGGDSLIGRFLDSIGGAGTSARVLQEVKDAFVAIGDAAVATWHSLAEGWRATIEGAGNARTAVIDFANRVSAWFDATFGKAFDRIRGFIGAAGDLFNALGDLVRSLGQRIWEEIVGAVSRALARVSGAFRSVASALGIDLDGALRGALDQARDIATTAEQAAEHAVATARREVPALLTNAGAYVASSAQAATASVQTATGAVRELNTHVQQNINAPITVSGVSDPADAARQVGDQLRAVNGDALESAHAAGLEATAGGG